ncbi:MAG TPA: hypothetical protein VFC79_03610, partial [Tissierellaceae bacterium]|nr:hypothetical protein [Tissierellaceae bacterium]
AIVIALEDAIRDGKLTQGELDIIHAALNGYNISYVAFQNAIEQARKAIEIEIDRIAKGYVDSLEIGGRNLLLNSNVDHRGQGYTGNHRIYSLSELIEDGETVTVTMKIDYDGTDWFYLMSQSPQVIIPNGSLSKISKGLYRKTFKWTNVKEDQDQLGFWKSGTGATWDLVYVKLEKGNKATDWTPAPEDVQAEIDGLEGYMEGAFQDNVIDKAEAKAIGEHLKTINDRYVTDNALYNNLIANTFLIGGVRTTLQNVMQNIYRRDKPLLETAINNIVNNKTVTTPLRTAFNTAFTNYRLAITSFQTAVEDARKAIEEQRVDNIEIGGRNLLLNSDRLVLSKSHELLDEYQGIKNVIKVVNPENSTYINPVEQYSEPLKPNEAYTLSVLFTYTGNNIGRRQLYMGAYQNTKGEIEEGKFRRIYVTFTRATYARIHMNFLGFDTIYLAEWKLEKGNKPTDWTPAPEDTVAEIQLAKAIPYQAGEYQAGIPYVRYPNSYPIVSYGESGGVPLYYALKGAVGTNKQPNLPANNTIWESVPSFKQVFTEVLFA